MFLVPLVFSTIRPQTPAAKHEFSLCCAQALVQYVRLVWAGNVKDLSRVSKDDPVISTDAELVMLRRAVVLIRALSAALSGTPVNMAAEWEPIARKVLADVGGDEPITSDPGIEIGAGVCLHLRTGSGTPPKYELVEIEFSGPLRGCPAMKWLDETEQFLWPHKKVSLHAQCSRPYCSSPLATPADPVTLNPVFMVRFAARRWIQ